MTMTMSDAALGFANFGCGKIVTRHLEAINSQTCPIFVLRGALCDPSKNDSGGKGGLARVLICMVLTDDDEETPADVAEDHLLILRYSLIIFFLGLLEH